MRFSKEWEKTVKRLGRWIDFERDYKTLDPRCGGVDCMILGVEV